MSCTNTGKLIVSNLLKSEVNQKMHFPEAVFLQLQIMKFGLVAVTSNSTFYVFTNEVVKKMVKFNLLTKWTPSIESEATFKKKTPTPIHNF